MWMDEHGLRKKLSKFVNTTWTCCVSFSYFPLRENPGPGDRETLQDVMMDMVDFGFGSMPMDSRDPGKVVDMGT